jgi:hypothetical protein
MNEVEIRAEYICYAFKAAGWCFVQGRSKRKEPLPADHMLGQP